MASKKTKKKAKKAAKKGGKKARSPAQKAATQRMIAAKKKKAKKGGRVNPGADGPLAKGKKGKKKAKKKASAANFPKAYRVKKNPEGGTLPLSTLKVRRDYLDRIIQERS